jgi:hypothetical protein
VHRAETRPSPSLHRVGLGGDGDLPSARQRPDEDARFFPIRFDWLDLVLPPLKSGYRVAGAFQDRAFVHPCWLAMQTERFFRKGHTFEDGHNWDTGELISWREYPELHLIPMTSLRGPAWLGQVFGDSVYHNGYCYATAALRQWLSCSD